MKRILAIALAALLLMAVLAACGGGDGKYLGKYQLSKVSSEGESYTVEEFADLMGMEVDEVKNMMYIELKSGGKGTFNLDDEPQEVTWKVDGEKLTLTADGETVDGTIKNDVITLGLDEETVEFTKAK